MAINKPVPNQTQPVAGETFDQFLQRTNRTMWTQSRQMYVKDKGWNDQYKRYKDIFEGKPVTLPDGMRSGTLPTTQRPWGVAIPGQMYPQVEGPGNPSWEARNPQPTNPKYQQPIDSTKIDERQRLLPMPIQPTPLPIRPSPIKPTYPSPIKPVQLGVPGATRPINNPNVPIVNPIIRPIKPPRQRILPVNKPVTSWY